MRAGFGTVTLFFSYYPLLFNYLFWPLNCNWICHQVILARAPAVCGVFPLQEKCLITRGAAWGCLFRREEVVLWHVGLGFRRSPSRVLTQQRFQEESKVGSSFVPDE